MFRYIVRRLLLGVPILLVSTAIVFFVVRNTIDPLAGAVLNPRVTQQDILRLRQDLGLDQPQWRQYTIWLAHFVRGDWGESLLAQRPVFPEIRSALVNTLFLGVVAVLFSLAIGVAIGVYSAVRQYSWFDHVSTGAAFLGLSIPNFWFALLLQVAFGIYVTRWLGLSESIFPVAGRNTPGTTGFNLLDILRHMVLPGIVLAVQIVAVYSRYMRASMLEVLHSDYLRTARAKGLRERRVIFRHAMRNALIPLTTQVALDFGAIAGGLIITEQVFEWPGMGRLFVDSMGRGDYMIVLPWVMITVTFVVAFNLIADILYAVLDPRIRYA